MRGLVLCRFNISASHDTIRDARRGDTWVHLNDKHPPIRIGRGKRTSAKKSEASAKILNMPSVREAMRMANSKRMVGSKIAAKLTTEQVRSIYLDPRPNRAIEREYGMSHGVVKDIKSGRTWKKETEDLRNAVII